MTVTTDVRKVAFLADYVPRQCGIATFTADIHAAVTAKYPEIQGSVIAVTDRPEGYRYPPEVRFEIPEQDVSAYLRAADFLNLANVDVLCVQHEYGIFGGPCGRHLLTLLRKLRMPVVTTLHTILKDPSPEQKRVLQDVVKLSARVISMAEKGVDFLKTIYDVPAEKIDLIPHGIPDVPFIDPNYYKDKFGVEGRLVLLTFGLLSPNKGIENVLNALPAIVRDHPDVVYIVLGATHPNLVRDQGETYRLSLERLAKKNGVEKNVIFFNRFVGKDELIEFLGATDIYITPYLNEAQITSGTLAYSFGAGKAVVSTPYWHAEELLACGRGVLVPFGDSEAIAGAVRKLIAQETDRHAMRKQAYLLGRHMIWPEVADLYVKSFEKARSEYFSQVDRPLLSPTLDQRQAELPVLNLEHLRALTDDTGILQHSVYTLPNYDHGYCTDDNARALILMILMDEMDEEFADRHRLTKVYAAFLQNAFVPNRGLFRNFMSYERRWLEEQGSEDCHGRALWALGTCVGRSGREGLRAWAADLFEKALPAASGLRSPRAWAFTIIGLHEYLRTLSGDLRANQLRADLSKRLLKLFRKVSGEDWFWFEDIVAYDNARLPQALILSGRWSNEPEMLEAGLKSLRWLVEKQIVDGHFRPIGSNGFWPRGAAPAVFDQQPLEAQAMIGACLEAYEATESEYWLQQTSRIFEWFHGNNDVGVALYDAQSGGCRDGLHIDRANQNQGAESTLAFLLSLVDMRRTQGIVSAFNPAINS